MVELPPGVSFTLHVTSIEAPSVPVTVAVNTCAPPVGTLGVVGDISTTMFGGGGGGDADPTVLAHADSKIAQAQITTRHKIGTQLRVTRTRRAKIRLVFLRSLASRMSAMEARDVPERSRQSEEPWQRGLAELRAPKFYFDEELV